MAGCLFGFELILTLPLFLGIRPGFGSYRFNIMDERRLSNLSEILATEVVDDIPSIPKIVCGELM